MLMLVHDRRRQPRLLCAEIVRVSWILGGGRRSRRIANLDDVSSGGACLVLDDPVPVGSTMVISCHSRNFKAKVRHCTQHGLGWLVGVEFETNSRWQTEMRRLGSLIDPRLLGGVLRPDRHP
jgi:hypothetical protein